jgi:hypothetical protein
MAVDVATSTWDARMTTWESGDAASEHGQEGLSAAQAAGAWAVLALASLLVAAPPLLAVAWMLSPAVFQAFP